MNILFITNLYPPASIGGYEQSCADVTGGLKQRGHTVAVLTSTTGMIDASESDGVRRILKISRNWNNRASFSLDRHNVPIVTHAIRQIKPDFVIVWNGGNLGRGFIAAAERNARVAYYLGDQWLAPILRPILRLRKPASKGLRSDMYQTAMRLLYYPFGSPRSERLIFVSRSLMEQYEREGVDVSAAVVIQNGISPEIFGLRDQRILARPPAAPARILYCGRMVADKGVATLIRAFKELRATSGLQETRLTLLGAIQNQEYGAYLRKLVAELGLANRVDFVPYQPRATLPEIYAEHDVLAFPSEWEEPFGLSLIEAMATGLPVVSTPCGAPGDIVRDGENGLLCRPRDPYHLAEKLSWLLTHPSEASRLGLNASAEVASKYTLKARVEGLESYLEGRKERKATAPSVPLASPN